MCHYFHQLNRVPDIDQKTFFSFKHLLGVNTKVGLVNVIRRMAVNGQILTEQKKSSSSISLRKTHKKVFFICVRLSVEIIN